MHFNVPVYLRSSVLHLYLFLFDKYHLYVNVFDLYRCIILR